MLTSFTYNFHKGNIEGFCQELRQVNIVSQWLADWLLFAENLIENPDTIEVKTSGSTGVPKAIQYSSLQAQTSALRSIEYFNLKKGMSAACPLSAKTIGGQMMFFRALFGSLELTLLQPDLHCFSHLKKEVDFIPCLVSQLQKAWEEQSPLKAKKILLGGSAIPEAVTEKLQSIPQRFYSSYGMTETLSHVAIRQLNGKEKSVRYKGLKGIRFTLNEQMCLNIKLPEHKEKIQTNDIAKIHVNGSIEIIGRADNFIITSGKKVNPETIEKAIENLVDGPYAISATPNETYGFVVTLVLENGASVNTDALKLWNKQQASHLKIRNTVKVEALPRVQNAKLNRKVLLELIKNL